jgi:pyruvate dehydrogenase E1 component alpha subunit
VGDVATLRAIYRPKTEEELWMTERDPIRLHAERLVAEGVTDQAALDRVKQELTVLMDAAMEFGINAPFPDTDKVDQDIYA